MLSLFLMVGGVISIVDESLLDSDEKATGSRLILLSLIIWAIYPLVVLYIGFKYARLSELFSNKDK